MEHDFLPATLVELIQEYQGAFRVKDGKLRLGTTYEAKLGNKKRNVLTFHVTAGMWFHHLTAPTYLYKKTTSFLILYHGDSKSILLDCKSIPETKIQEHVETLLIVASGKKFHFARGTKYLKPITSPSYIIIPLICVGDDEYNADHLTALHHFRQNRVQETLAEKMPKQEIEYSSYDLVINGMSAGGWKEAFPRLKEYEEATELAIERSNYGGESEIILEFCEEKSIHLKEEDLYGGNVEKEMKDYLHPEDNPSCMRLYRALMQWMSKKEEEDYFRPHRIEEKDGVLWIIAEKWTHERTPPPRAKLEF